jgi:hypothetical protein
LLAVAVILASAVLIVRWRDPLTGEALPVSVSIFLPVLIGGLFHGLGSALLRLLGIRTWAKPEEYDPNYPPEE